MLSNSRAAHHPHNHDHCVASALERAQSLCQQRNANLTPIRQQVLQILWESHVPLGAYQLIDRLSAANGKQVAPPTVYRAIDFLLELGLIHRISSLNAFVGCPFPGLQHSDLFLICRNCNATAEVANDNINQMLLETSRKAGFALENQSLELSGLCRQCQSEEGSRND